MTTAIIKSSVETDGPPPVGSVPLKEKIWDEMAEARAMTVCETGDGYRISFDIVLNQEARVAAERIGAAQGRGVANVVKRAAKLGLRLFLRDGSEIA
jgi:hypothetical protein